MDFLQIFFSALDCTKDPGQDRNSNIGCRGKENADAEVGFSAVYGKDRHQSREAQSKGSPHGEHSLGGVTVDAEIKPELAH